MTTRSSGPGSTGGREGEDGDGRCSIVLQIRQDLRIRQERIENHDSLVSYDGEYETARILRRTEEGDLCIILLLKSSHINLIRYFSPKFVTFSVSSLFLISLPSSFSSSIPVSLSSTFGTASASMSSLSSIHSALVTSRRESVSFSSTSFQSGGKKRTSSGTFLTRFDKASTSLGYSEQPLLLYFSCMNKVQAFLSPIGHVKKRELISDA